MLNAVQCLTSDAITQKPILDETARIAADWQNLDAEQLGAIINPVATNSLQEFSLGALVEQRNPASPFLTLTTLPEWSR